MKILILTKKGREVCKKEIEQVQKYIPAPAESSYKVTIQIPSKDGSVQIYGYLPKEDISMTEVESLAEEPIKEILKTNNEFPITKSMESPLLDELLETDDLEEEIVDVPTEEDELEKEFPIIYKVAHYKDWD